MYELSKNRFLELKHFGMQYYEWTTEWVALRDALDLGGDDPTGEVATRLAWLDQRIKLVYETVMEAFGEDKLAAGFASITKGMDFPKHFPEYEMRRKFYWLLDQKR